MGLLNDLWVFNSDYGEWKWIAGNSTVNVPRNYTDPGGRMWAASAMDKDGEFWIFGGRGGMQLY